MVDCQIIKDGKVEGEVRQNGLTFIDNHGMERSNHIESDALEVSLKEWHYQKFGIMNQHYLGKANNAKFIAQHEVRPALLFSMPTLGGSMKEVYGNRGTKKGNDVENRRGKPLFSKRRRWCQHSPEPGHPIRNLQRGHPTAIH